MLAHLGLYRFSLSFDCVLSAVGNHSLALLCARRYFDPSASILFHFALDYQTSDVDNLPYLANISQGKLAEPGNYLLIYFATPGNIQLKDVVMRTKLAVYDERKRKNANCERGGASNR